MNIFNRKIKITPENMGLVVYEMSRIRIEGLIKDCEEDNIKYKIAPLEVYTFIYNFFLIEQILMKKYNNKTIIIINQLKEILTSFNYYV